MRVTKYTHSCLLIEDKGLKILIDPGNYATFETAQLDQLDYLLITHKHQDHMHLPLIQEIIHKFPNAQIITNPDAAGILEKFSLDSVGKANDNIKFKEVPHEDVLVRKPPILNWQFDVFSKLTHPGDSHSFSTTQEILALPMTAPWGSLVNALKLALKLKPKVVLPIHDWHWNDQARQGSYQFAATVLEKEGIDFKKLVDGDTTEV